MVDVQGEFPQWIHENNRETGLDVQLGGGSGLKMVGSPCHRVVLWDPLVGRRE